MNTTLRSSTTTSSTTTRSARVRRSLAAALCLAGVTALAIPAVSQAAPKPSIKTVKPFQVRWLTLDGGSISVEQAMDIAAAGGNPNTAHSDPSTRH